jgi:hypothetical protein
MCHKDLQELDKVECNITNMAVYKESHSKSWFGFAPQNNSLEIVSFSYCPFDYCNSTVKQTINVSDPKSANSQCAFNRYGILCGGCKENFSIVFSSSGCCDCSGEYSLLRVIGLLLLFALVGLGLVVFLGVTDMTVANGTLNAVIFYVNVVAVNKSIFLVQSANYPVLTFVVKVLRVFVSWTNLDVGIEVCFYNGMTSFGKALLQFVFPLYLWCISGAIIILCRKSIMVSKLFGRNSVKVLATVILLSYAKLLRAIIDVLFYTPLHHSSGFYTKMWRIDGNVYYLGPKHIILFVIAAFVGLITLPYTLALFFIQCLRKWSNFRVLFWVHRLKPFFDAYTGPYKDRYHFWTGLLLVVRICLFLFLAMNKAPIGSLSVIGATASLLPLFLQSGIYISHHLTTIEVFTYSNLTVFCIATAYFTGFDYDNSPSILLCVGSIFLLFFGIVSCRVSVHLLITQKWQLVKVWLLDKRWPWIKRTPVRPLIIRSADDEEGSSSESEVDPLLHGAPPVARYDELREPCIN